MGKVCAVFDCPSGHNKDKVRRKQAGLQQVSLFRVPKQADMLEKWNEILEMNLSSKDLVCELHFPSQCILAEYITEMPDGTLHRMPRDRCDLAKDALPISGTREENVILCQDEAPEQNDALELPADTKENSITSSQDDELLISGLEGSPDFKEDIEETETIEEHLEQVDDCQLEPEAEQFSIDDVVRYFRETPLRPAWCWMRNMRDQNCVILTQLDPCTLSIRLVLKLHNNLSVTLHTSDDKVILELNGLVTSVQKIERLLDTMERKTVVCSGTGFQYQSRADDCSGFMSPKDFGRFVPVPRCEECQRLRKNLRRRRKMDVHALSEQAGYPSHPKQLKVELLKEKTHISDDDES